MTTRSRNAAILAAVVVALGAVVVVAARSRPMARPTDHAVYAVPTDAQVVITANVQAVRSSALARLVMGGDSTKQLTSGVEAQCGFDPMDSLTELAVWMPQEPMGEFGLASIGDIRGADMVRCARATIGARSGSAVVEPREGFSLVSDSSLGSGAAAIAVRDHGPLLLGRAGALAKMMAAVAGRAPHAEEQGQHAELRSELGHEGHVMLSAIVSDTMRQRVRAWAAPDVTPLEQVTSLVASVHLGKQTSLRAVVRCASSQACMDLEKTLMGRRAELRESMPMRIAGVARLLDSAKFECRIDHLWVKLDAPSEEIVEVVQRIWRWDDALGGGLPPAPARSSFALPDEVLRMPRPDGGK